MKRTLVRKVCLVMFLHKKENVLRPLFLEAHGEFPVICKALKSDLMDLLL
jgi:hypothetical protein